MKERFSWIIIALIVPSIFGAPPVADYPDSLVYYQPEQIHISVSSKISEKMPKIALKVALFKLGPKHF